MKLYLKITGWLLIGLAIIHAVFPTYFNWKKELHSLSLINRQMVYVHTFFIALIVLLMGMLCICATADIIETGLGKKLSLGLCIFWSVRLLIQLFGYSSRLWKGKAFETGIHILFLFLWTYFALVFFAVFYTANSV